MLELRDGGEHGEDQFTAHVVARVEHDSVEGAEVAALGVQVVFDDGEEFAGVAAQPGQVEHDEGVAAAHVIEGGGQAGPGGALDAGWLVEVNPGAAGGLEGVDLVREFLGVGGYSGSPMRSSRAAGSSLRMT